MTSEQRTPARRRVVVAPSGQSSWDATTTDAFAAVPESSASLDDVLAWAVEVGTRIPLPGSGRTLERWEFLASVAAHDVGTSRILEPHLDAIAILIEARSEDVEHPRSPARGGSRSRADSGAESQVVDTVERLLDATANGASWGVFASGGAASTLAATQHGDEWRLTGRKPWCSLGAVLSHALVTASTPSGDSRLFAVDLGQDGVRAHTGPWIARGLREVVSAPIDFDGVRATPVGAEGWYLARPGFAWGGMGVAACWFGGAVGVARALSETWTHREPDALHDAATGAIDVLLQTSGGMLGSAASIIDRGASASATSHGSRAEPEQESLSVSPSILMKRVRGAVAPSVATIIERVQRVLGPGPSTTDEAFAKRVADLQLYLAQHHWERDDVSLGRGLRALGRSPW
ncbi:acyl-CoA dehydrogenase [Plantibacter sp. YIM 135347]|uniref:acyl-CoA dehydrogenase n=1 Tax=Plantibacter sp. YIM 135347 TaxID=3423919 RepID=UPI003D325727